MPENRPSRPTRPTPTYPNIGDFNRISDRFPKERIDPKETRIRELEREVAELRRYKEEQEEKENPRVRKYRKKPVVIEAIRFTTVEALKKAFPDIFVYKKYKKKVVIQTLEGEIVISKGDYIIKGIKGEYYPCKPDVFEESYERA